MSGSETPKTKQIAFAPRKAALDRRPLPSAARVDLVLETSDGLVVVGHKAYGGDAAGRDARIRS